MGKEQENKNLSDYHRHLLIALSIVTLHLVAGAARIGEVEDSIQEIPKNTFQMSLEEKARGSSLTLYRINLTLFKVFSHHSRSVFDKD